MRRPLKRLPHAGHVHVDVPWPGQRAGGSDVLDNAGGRGGSATERPSQLRHALPGGWAPTQRSVLVADDGRFQESLRPESDQSLQRERPVGLAPNADGSVDVYIQRTSPVGHESNWLPAPSDKFSLWLRVYLPGRVILDGRYPVPPVAQAG